jgi:hypothetical protein
MDESPFRHPFPEEGGFIHIEDFPSQSAYLEFPKVLTAVVYAVRR